MEAEVRLDGVGRMVARNFDVYRKTWYVNALPPLAEPLLYLLAIGYALGTFVGDIDGVAYRAYIAPGILAITVMQTAFMETTYSSYVRLVFQRTWDAVMATPLSAADVLWGEVAWGAVRATINACLMTAVVAALGLLAWPTALWIVPLAFALGFLFAGMGLWVSSKVKVIDQFSYAFFLFVTPQFLFAGTFFPLHALPEAGRWVAYALPLTHAVQVLRGASLGVWPPDLAFHLAYLAVACVLVPGLAVRAMRARIVR